ncbi:MAG: hypothetical protein ACFFCW_42380, partial [Candidatus Hodarchaeota archaeon]
MCWAKCANVVGNSFWFLLGNYFTPFSRFNYIVPYGKVPFETFLNILVHFTTVHNGTNSISKVMEMDEKTKILLVRAIYG